MDYTNKYTINRTRLLGRGITSEVYHGFNIISKQEVAIKIISKKIKNIKFYIQNEIQNIYNNIIEFPSFNIFTPILKKIFYSNGNVFISAIKRDIEKLEIEDKKDIKNKEDKKDIDDIEYVFV